MAGMLLGLSACGAEQQTDAERADAAAVSDADVVALEADARRVFDSVEYPSLRGVTLAGQHIDLVHYRGHWVLVNFWATWCSPCLREMADLSALATSDVGIVVIGIAYEDSSPETMRAFLETQSVEYPVLLSTPSQRVENFPTPSALPVSYLLSPEGRVVRRFVGPLRVDTVFETMVATPTPVSP